MKHNEDTQKTGGLMQASLTFNGNQRSFNTDDVESDVNFGKRWFQGYQVAQESDGQQEAFTQITLQFPEEYLSEGKALVIGNGENAEVSAYFGSTSIGRSGWANKGRITITQWNEHTRQFGASFHFELEASTGEVQVMNGSLCMSLATDNRTTRLGTGHVQAKLDPVIFRTLGDLDTKTIKFVDLTDGRIRLTATQEGQSAAQGVHVFFNDQSARMFFRINNGVYDMPGGNLQHHWDEQAKRLTVDFSNQVVTYQGLAHLVSNGSIDASRT